MTDDVDGLMGCGQTCHVFRVSRRKTPLIGSFSLADGENVTPSAGHGEELLSDAIQIGHADTDQ